MPRIAVLFFNIGHCNEHCGKLVTYIRLNHIVPPSSEIADALTSLAV